MRGEPMLLGEMIRNLIENALAYAGPGTEATVKVIADGAEVLLEVEDTGPGIPAAELESVRQRFVRGGRATSRAPASACRSSRKSPPCSAAGWNFRPEPMGAGSGCGWRLPQSRAESRLSGSRCTLMHGERLS